MDGLLWLKMYVILIYKEPDERLTHSLWLPSPSDLTLSSPPDHCDTATSNWQIRRPNRPIPSNG